MTGRHQQLLHEAIDEYSLSVPDYAIGDVGTTIYEARAGEWTSWRDWHDEIGRDWKGMVHDDSDA